MFEKDWRPECIGCLNNNLKFDSGSFTFNLNVNWLQSCLFSDLFIKTQFSIIGPYLQ